MSSTREATEEVLRSSLQAVANGDEEALRRVYDVTSARIYGLVLGMVKRAEVADEIVADAYHRLWTHAFRYRPEQGSVRVWLATIARRRAIDWLRKVRAEPALGGDVELEHVEEHGPGPLEESLAAERSEVIHAALGALSLDQRLAIEATFFEGLTHSEAAAVLGHPLGTIKSRVRQALSTIRRRLEPSEKEAS